MGVTAVFSNLLPLRTLKLLESLEQGCAVLLGKRWGACGLSHEVRPIVSLLPEVEAVVLDVGAHRGEWAEAILSQATSRIAKVYAFEPSPALASIIQAKELPKVEVVQAAVSDTTGRRTLFGPTLISTALSLHNRSTSVKRFEPLTEVDTVTLDEFTESRAIPHVDAVKLDVEGHELSALRGASGLLTKGRIGAISFEFGAANVDSRTFFKDIWDFLWSFGFRMGRILPGGRVLSIRDYDLELERVGKSMYLAASH